jgi:hypothetical protein
MNAEWENRTADDAGACEFGIWIAEFGLEKQNCRFVISYELYVEGGGGVNRPRLRGPSRYSGASIS